jgi:hypothetical protein
MNDAEFPLRQPVVISLLSVLLKGHKEDLDAAQRRTNRLK